MLSTVTYCTLTVVVDCYDTDIARVAMVIAVLLAAPIGGNLRNSMYRRLARFMLPGAVFAKVEERGLRSGMSESGGGKLQVLREDGWSMCAGLCGTLACVCLLPCAHPAVHCSQGRDLKGLSNRPCLAAEAVLPDTWSFAAVGVARVLVYGTGAGRADFTGGGRQSVALGMWLCATSAEEIAWCKSNAAGLVRCCADNMQPSVPDPERAQSLARAHAVTAMLLARAATQIGLTASFMEATRDSLLNWWGAAASDGGAAPTSAAVPKA